MSAEAQPTAAQSEEWRTSFAPGVRDDSVKKLVNAILPSSDPAINIDPRFDRLVSYANQVEKNLFEKSANREDYDRLVAAKIEQIQRELQEKHDRQNANAETDENRNANNTSKIDATLNNSLNNSNVLPHIFESPVLQPPLSYEAIGRWLNMSNVAMTVPDEIIQQIPLPEPPAQPREWHGFITPELRSHLIGKLLKTIYPSPIPAVMHDQRIKDLISYARKVEKDMFEQAADKEVYYHLLAEKIYKIQKELQEKKNQRADNTSKQTVNATDVPLEFLTASTSTSNLLNLKDRIDKILKDIKLEPGSNYLPTKDIKLEPISDDQMEHQSSDIMTDVKIEPIDYNEFIELSTSMGTLQQFDEHTSSIDLPANSVETVNERNESVKRCISSLVHSCQCRVADCQRVMCHKMKRVVKHTRVCRKRQQTNCQVCKQLIALCCYHAKHCNQASCLVPFCINIRQKLQEQAVADA